MGLTQEQEEKIKNATPAELTLMLYDGALSFLDEAKAAIGKDDKETACAKIRRAEAIINELRMTLNDEYEVAEIYSELYGYIYRLLLKSDAESSVVGIDEAHSLISGLREIWQGAMDKMKEEMAQREAKKNGKEKPENGNVDGGGTSKTSQKV